MIDYLKFNGRTGYSQPLSVQFLVSTPIKFAASIARSQRGHPEE
jgi:hypothetical protein